MQSVKLTVAAVLATSLLSTVPTTAGAQERGQPQLLRILMLLKAAPGTRAAKEPSATAPTRLGPTKPSVPRPLRPELLAASGDEADIPMSVPAGDDRLFMDRRSR